GMWGIPGDPRAKEVVAALGTEAAARAAQDLETPMDAWAKRRAAGEPITVGDLVADRFGPVVVERLVAPVVAGVHSADPYDVDIDKIAPGLVDKAIEYGSVAKAIATLRATAPPGAAVKSLRGGMQKFARAVVAYVQRHGQLHFDTKAVALDIDSGTVFTETGQLFHGDNVVCDVDAPTAYYLRYNVTTTDPRPQLPQGNRIQEPHHARHDGTKAATHVTAKWERASASATKLNKHRHVVRLSYGRVTDPSDGSVPGYDTSEDALRELAYKDLAKIFDVPKQRVLENVAAIASVRWRESMPLTTPENAQRIAAIQDAVEAIDGLHATGAWFAGTGLAAITQHALALRFNPLQ